MINDIKDFIEGGLQPEHGMNPETCVCPCNCYCNSGGTVQINVNTGTASSWGLGYSNC